MTITAPDAPTLPSLNDPANFNTRALALFSWLVTEYIPWLETLAGVTEDGEINGTPIGQKVAAAGKFTTLLADSLGGAAVQSSRKDSTVGKLLLSGAYGWGYKGGNEFTETALNPVDPAVEAARVIVATVGTTDKPGGRDAWTGLRLKGNNADQIADFMVSYHWGAAPRVAVRHNNKDNNEFTGWYQLITDEGGQKINGSLLCESLSITPSGNVDSTFRLNNQSGNSWKIAQDVSQNSSLAFYGYAGNSGDIFFQPNGATALKIDVSGNTQAFGDFTVDTDTLHVDSTLNRLGLGTTNPADKLHVLGSAIFEGSFPNIRILETDTTDVNTRLLNNAGQFLLQTMADNGAGTTRMVVDHATGHIGVGNPSPPVRLSAKTNGNDERVGEFFASGAGFADIVFTAKTQRAASADFSLFKMGTGNFADVEFDFTGDGLGISDRGWQSTGADYAEFFEWLDGNPNGEARTGVAVVLEGDKIRPAREEETPIGVISANPSVIGDGDIDRWRGKYLCDDFGAYIWENYEVVSWTETITESGTVQEQATEAQEVTREVIEVVDGQAVKKIVTETIQVPLFDEIPLVDEQGNPVMEEYEKLTIPAEYDENGDEVKPEETVKGQRQVIHYAPRMIDVQQQTTKEEKHSYAADEVPEGITVPADATRVTQKRRKLNPEYDPSQPYIPRAERPEWDLVGLMGKLRLRKGQPVAPNWIKMRDVSAEVEEWLIK